MRRPFALAVFTAMTLSLPLCAQAQTTAPGTPATAPAMVPPPAARATPEAQPPLSPVEKAFVTRIQTELPKRYPNPAAAERAGYHRYNNEDASGAISYVNLKWNSTDAMVPAQLWYDINGRLLGADYSMLQVDSADAPTLFGLQQVRFHKIPAHVHYVLKSADGSLTYGHGIGAAAYAAAGGDIQHPTAVGLVKAGRATSPDQVAFVFLYPSIWDTSIWVLPNPNGAFADLNPNVHPSAARPTNSNEGH